MEEVDYFVRNKRVSQALLKNKDKPSAADMSKLAMIKLGSNQELKDLGFRMLIPVHDEIIGEFPKENLHKVIPLVKDCMINAVHISVPIKCDVEITDRWYGEPVEIKH